MKKIPNSCHLPQGVFCRLSLPSNLEMSLRDSPVCLLETVQEVSCELVRMWDIGLKIVRLTTKSWYLFSFGRICFPRLIYCGQRWLLFFSVYVQLYKPINSIQNFRCCFTLALFKLPHLQKAYGSPLKLTDKWITSLLFDLN